MRRPRDCHLTQLRDHVMELRKIILAQILHTGGPGEPPTDWNKLRAMLSVGHTICAEGEAASKEIAA